MTESGQTIEYPIWRKEEEPIKSYLQLRPGNKETPVICIYEYAREIWWFMGEGESRAKFFSRGIPWPYFRKFVPAFPRRPYNNLSPKEKEGIKEFFMEGFSIQRTTIDYYTTGVLKEFEEQVLKHHKEIMTELALPRHPPATIPEPLPRLRNTNLDGCREYIEHVIFTLDYSKGRERLKKEFARCLEENAK